MRKKRGKSASRPLYQIHGGQISVLCLPPIFSVFVFQGFSIIPIIISLRFLQWPGEAMVGKGEKLTVTFECRKIFTLEQQCTAHFCFPVERGIVLLFLLALTACFFLHCFKFPCRTPFTCRVHLQQQMQRQIVCLYTLLIKVE